MKTHILPRFWVWQFFVKYKWYMVFKGFRLCIFILPILPVMLKIAMIQQELGISPQWEFQHFYVKSILENARVQKMPFLPI